MKSENKKMEQALLGAGSEGGGAKILYTYVNKCKNNKIKKEKIISSKPKKKVSL
jgi:hypothetical protein